MLALALHGAEVVSAREMVRVPSASLYFAVARIFVAVVQAWTTAK